MLKKIFWLDVKLRFYCFILRLELEYICGRKNSEKLWRNTYLRVTDPLKPFRPTLNEMYRLTHRKFVKNTVAWVDYFVELYDQRYLNADPGSVD